MNTSLKIVLWLLCLCAADLLGLSKFHLKDGSVLTGIIFDQTETNITATIDFNPVTLPKSEIVEIENLPDLDVYVLLRSGKIVFGKFLFQDYDRIRIMAEELGELTVFRTNVERIQWKPFEEEKPVNVTAPLSTPLPHGKYCYSAVWRSAVLPSWGQFNKKEKKKGIFIAGTEGALLVFSVIASVRSGILSSSHVGSEQSFQNWQHIARLSWLVTGSFYIYNVLDALVSEPALDSSVVSPVSRANNISLLLTFPF